MLRGSAKSAVPAVKTRSTPQGNSAWLAAHVAARTPRRARRPRRSLAPAMPGPRQRRAAPPRQAPAPRSPGWPSGRDRGRCRWRSRRAMQRWSCASTAKAASPRAATIGAPVWKRTKSRTAATSNAGASQSGVSRSTRVRRTAAVAGLSGARAGGRIRQADDAAGMGEGIEHGAEQALAVVRQDRRGRGERSPAVHVPASRATVKKSTLVAAARAAAAAAARRLRRRAAPRSGLRAGAPLAASGRRASSAATISAWRGARPPT